MSFVVTYETLFDLLRKESSKEDLQVLPGEFYGEARSFIEKKRAEADAGGAAGQRAAIEYENAKKILRELYDRRERKILLLALNKARTESAIIDPSVLLPAERDLFDTLVDELKGRKRDVLAGLGLGDAPSAPVERPREPQAPEQTKTLEEPPERHETPDGHVKVKFLSPVPKFVGKDMTIFGPYDPGAVEELPEDIAAVLLKKGRAERA